MPKRPPHYIRILTSPYRHSLKSSIFHGTQPAPIFSFAAAQYLTLHSVQPSSLESPLYPGTNFSRLEHYPGCSARTLELIKWTAHLVEIVAFDSWSPLSLRAYCVKKDTLRNQLYSFAIPDQPNAINGNSADTNIYQACLHATTLLEAACYSAIPLRAAAATPQCATLVADLQATLMRTDLHGLWGDAMAGVLLYVSFVGSAATRDVASRAWFVALATRAMLIHGFAHARDIVAAQVRMLQVQRYCAYQRPSTSRRLAVVAG